MPMTSMPRLLPNLLVLLLLPFTAQAHSGPGPLPGGGFPRGPRLSGPPAPNGPKQPPLSFEEARNYAMRAAAVAGQLQAGSLSLKRTPQGQRLNLALTYQGRPVALVTLRPDLSFAERPGVPLLPDVSQLPALGSAERQTLTEQIGRLATSGLAQATGPHVRVALLSDGAAVADLRFDRATGILLAEAPDRSPDGARGGPTGPRPPKK